MISKKKFRIKKNGEPYKYCFCKHPELIENYDKAIADKTQVWECHHRMEAIYTKEELIKYGLYYDREPHQLIFLTPFEHNSLHNKGKKKSEEHKQKIGNSLRRQLINRKDESKPILCVETGKVFESMSEAYRKTGVYVNNISSVCNGKRKTAGGYHWQYA